jgi:mRNA-degrading endonuclease toxin of MazEF toxin-antitoxin module
VRIDARFFQRDGVFDVQGIGTVPRVKLREKIGDLSAEQLAEVEIALCRWLGLPPAPTSSDDIE